jgi:hypothetical protein
MTLDIAWITIAPSVVPIRNTSVECHGRGGVVLHKHRKVGTHQQNRMIYHLAPWTELVFYRRQ